MNRSPPFKPKTHAHPGQVLCEYLCAHHLSPAELARRVGLPAQHVHALCAGRTALTAHTAHALESIFERPAHFWLALQRQYDEEQLTR